MNNKKVWVEIDRANAAHNVKAMRRILSPRAKLLAVVKSNAYGHGLTLFSKLIEPGVDGFCVDSVVEGRKLREAGIKKFILVLGPTLDGTLLDAAVNDITVTVSSWEALKNIQKAKQKPEFHLKIDTGMHRQGFYLADLPKVIKTIENRKLSAGGGSAFGGKTENCLTGVYTHFASAKDINYPAFTDFQFHAFKKALVVLRAAGFSKLLRHAAATGGAMVKPEYHLDAARVGIGLYGLYPSKELELQRHDVLLKPVLSWRSVVTEIKEIKKGGYVGYDLAERVFRPIRAAVVPVGYWYGFDRGLSGIGEVLIKGERARVLGRVSMDLIVVDVTRIPAKVGDIVTMIGLDKGEEITAYEMAQRIATSHYEIITRINPLTERILV